MAFTATQYLFKATNHTASTTATVGGYVVPAATKGMGVGLTCANTATTNRLNYVDVSIFDGTTQYPLLVRTPVYPGGNIVVMGFEKMVLPTGGSVYVTPYATAGLLTSAMTVIEVT